MRAPSRTCAFLLALPQLGLFLAAPGQGPGLEGGTREERVPIVLAGRVLTPEGRPASGARVQCRAGGEALTGADGSFRIELELFPEVESLWLEAVDATGTQSGARRVTLAASGLGSIPILPAGSMSLTARGPCTPPGWTPTFGGGPGIPAGSIGDLVVHDLGSGPALIAGGSFKAAGGHAARYVARWDGARWWELGGGLEWHVYAFAVLDAGGGQPPQLFAAGAGFAELGGYVARLDGASWTVIGRPDGAVFTLAVFDDGSGPALHAGGEFTSFGGVAAAHVAKWDGTSWSSLGAGTNALVKTLQPLDIGTGLRLYAGGSFTSAGGASANRIARWNGASWEAVGTGMNNDVETLEVFDDGTGLALHAGGAFTSAGGVPASRLARWNGTAWSALGGGASSTVYVLEVLDDGSGGGPALFAGGQFVSVNGQSARRVARWDGTSWTSLASGVQDGLVTSLVAFDDGGGRALFAGGRFASAGGLPANNVARWGLGSWSALGTERAIEDEVTCLAVFDDGTGTGPALHAGYGLTLPPFGIARWDGVGVTEIATVTNGHVDALAVFDDGSGPALVAGGDFTVVGGVAANRVARWNGLGWMALGSGMDRLVWDLVGHDDGSGSKLYAGGEFTSAGGVAASHIARWNGFTWEAVGGGTNGRVRCLAVHDAGAGPELYAAGDFSMAGGISASSIARWDGTQWQALVGGLVPGIIEGLASHDDGSGSKLYAGGNYPHLGNIVRWDGALWSTVGQGRPNTVRALAVLDDGSGAGAQLFVGTRGNGINLVGNRMARWDGSAWSGLASQMDEQVNALAVYDAGQGAALFAGGQFEGSAAGDSFLARWQGCPDTDPPVLACAPIQVYGRRVFPGEFVEFTVPVEDRDPHVTVVCIPPSGSLFPFGTTLVTCTATDGSGNTSSCTFPVVVAPRVRPR
jgi:HYR domain-containing protein